MERMIGRRRNSPGDINSVFGLRVIPMRPVFMVSLQMNMRKPLLVRVIQLLFGMDVRERCLGEPPEEDRQTRDGLGPSHQSQSTRSSDLGSSSAAKRSEQNWLAAWSNSGMAERTLQIALPANPIQ